MSYINHIRMLPVAIPAIAFVLGMAGPATGADETEAEFCIPTICPVKGEPSMRRAATLCQVISVASRRSPAVLLSLALVASSCMPAAAQPPFDVSDPVPAWRQSV